MEPRLLLLDEPVAGVNPTMTKQILGLIDGLNKKGMTILIIEHNMNVMMRFCDRLVVMDHGREIADGRPSSIKNNRKVNYQNELKNFEWQLDGIFINIVVFNFFYFFQPIGFWFSFNYFI